MKIIIDIDESIYARFVAGFANEDDAYLIEQLFKNGTPLPEGHGDLIDRSKLIYFRCPNNVKDCPSNYDFTCNSCDFGITHKFRIDCAEVVIAADK